MTWFKNLTPYLFTESCDDLIERLESSLLDAELGECPATEAFIEGWVSPLGSDVALDNLVYTGSEFALIALGREERILPSSVINDYADELRVKIELDESRTVGAKERRELKERATFELLPRAFKRRKFTRALAWPSAKMFWVDTASVKSADDLTAMLRKTAGALPLVPMTGDRDPMHVFTAWMAGEAPLPEGFELSNNAVLEDPRDGSTVRLTNQELDADEVLNHLKSGKLTKQVGMVWQDRIHFTLDQNLALKSIKYADSIQEQVDNESGGDRMAEVDATLALMTAELQPMLMALESALTTKMDSDVDAPTDA
ncbi:MAG: recombination-associated protein RdgC [Gammaproteobacteria bacterium]|nr:recombination-associated protein RdgC [Gammaproteobacteria bacterium]